jgi:hypothetical protein
MITPPMPAPEDYRHRTPRLASESDDEPLDCRASKLALRKPGPGPQKVRSGYTVASPLSARRAGAILQDVMHSSSSSRLRPDITG